MESEGILCVFLTFHTAAWEQKIRCPAADDLFRVSLVRHPFKSPFAPISQIAEGQIFKIWEYYLILGEVGSYWERLGRRVVVERLLKNICDTPPCKRRKPGEYKREYKISWLWS